MIDTYAFSTLGMIANVTIINTYVQLSEVFFILEFSLFLKHTSQSIQDVKMWGGGGARL